MDVRMGGWIIEMGEEEEEGGLVNDRSLRYAPERHTDGGG